MNVLRTYVRYSLGSIVPRRFRENEAGRGGDTGLGECTQNIR